MAAIFKTFGPFELHRRGGVDSESLEDFWEQDGMPTHLREECGIYIICSQHGLAPLKPWYVGQTHRRYEGRFKGHLRSGKLDEISELAPNGALKIFLIARRTVTNRSTRSARRNSKAIREMEFALIGACVPLNESLLNVSEVNFFRGMHVPGFHSSKRGKPTAAAQRLKQMLGPKR